MSLPHTDAPQEGRAADSRLRPTPDYGTLGPGSDLAAGSTPDRASSANNFHLKPFVAIAIGVLAAVLVGNIRSSASVAWHHLADLFAIPTAAPNSPGLAPVPAELARLDHLKPQKQAETLLELAVGNSDGAVDQIASRVNRWQGKVNWSPQLGNLTTAALNSRDLRIRESGIEVELVAYGLTKNSSNLQSLIRDAESDDHARKIWALWALGAMANRGVEPGRVFEVLTAHLRDSDEDSRRWTVEGLALMGTTETVGPLLQAMHDDSSALVRERAACSLAESGLLTKEQRLTAVPQLVLYTDDPSLDAQTHAWAFQALTEITGQHLPQTPGAWRSWYENRAR